MTGFGTRPVSFALKCCVLDARHAGAVIPHIIKQARFPFAEKIVVVDPRTAFTGKYRSRPHSTLAELRQVLNSLVTEGIVDRVVELPSNQESEEECLARYFGDEGSLVSRYAVTGGPIYGTLFALDACRHDLVVQTDCDILFHTDGESWVAACRDLLTRDPTLWLGMTHPGPPAGPQGKSLRGRHATHAQWDPGLGIWRFRTASTRYFLVDRTRLYGRLPLLLDGNGSVRPLEESIGAALVHGKAHRMVLGRCRSWHLHVYRHDPPFPELAAEIIDAVERGSVPPEQLGNYDLRLDVQGDRAAWLRWLEAADPGRRTSS